MYNPTKKAVIRGGYGHATYRSSRRLRLSGRMNFQLRVEMFNAFNNVQWNNPSTTVALPLFGSVTETQSNDPGFVQLAFRLSF